MASANFPVGFDLILPAKASSATSLTSNVSATCAFSFGRQTMIINVCKIITNAPAKKYSAIPALVTQVMNNIIIGITYIIICICFFCSAGIPIIDRYAWTPYAIAVAIARTGACDERLIPKNDALAMSLEVLMAAYRPINTRSEEHTSELQS